MKDTKDTKSTEGVENPQTEPKTIIIDGVEYEMRPLSDEEAEVVKEELFANAMAVGNKTKAKA
jgi:hypothetical protein